MKRKEKVGRDNKMRKEMFNRGIVFWMLLLMVGTSFTSAIGGTFDVAGNMGSSGESRIWYVNCSNPEEGDGSYENPFQRIKLAVNKASAGDTVIVFPGTYEEEVEINKSIKLQGVDKHNTTITTNTTNKKGNGISITASHVTVSGFTIVNCENGVSITNTNTDPDKIISNLHITNCTITDNSANGIRAKGVRTKKRGPSVDLIRVTLCCIINNGRKEEGAGIYGENAVFSEISHCRISENEKDGIYMINTPVSLIERNIITENGAHGIHLEPPSKSTKKRDRAGVFIIQYNNISGNYNKGIHVGVYGFLVLFVSWNNFINNNENSPSERFQVYATAASRVPPLPFYVFITGNYWKPESFEVKWAPLGIGPGFTWQSKDKKSQNTPFPDPDVAVC